MSIPAVGNRLSAARCRPSAVLIGNSQLAVVLSPGTDNRLKPMNHFAKTLTAVIAIMAVTACTDLQEFKGTYEEAAPLASTRDTAYQLTFFRFGDEVGGVVRFFELNAPSGLNTTERPYGEESYCHYFGPIQVSGNAIAFQSEGPDGDTHGFRLSSLADDRINVSVHQIPDEEEDAGDETQSFDVFRVSSSTRTHCEARGAYEVLVQIPDLTGEEIDDLNLAIGFAGYDLDDGDGHIVVHEFSEAQVVPRGEADSWNEETRIAFPQVPPSLSAENDPLQPGVLYSLAYLVLFDDNGDGAFNQFTEEADRVLAVSLDYAVFYLDGDASGLAESVQSVFANPGVLPQGYSVHRIETEIVGRDAFVSEAVQFGSTVIELTPVDDVLGLFPQLVPSEER